MRETRWVGNNSIGDEWFATWVSRKLGRIIEGLVLRVWFRWWPKSISSLYTRSPTSHKHFLNTPPSLADLSTRDRVEARHQARVLDHKGHELGGVTANAEEFEPIPLHEGLESGVGCDSYPMAICIFEDLAQGNERLDIATGANNLDHDIETRGRGLAWLATETWRDVRWREDGVIFFGFDSKLPLQSRCEQVGEPPILGVDVDINSSITWVSPLSVSR